MITYHKEYGCWFQMTEDAKHYALYEAKTYKHNSTSDRVIIWDEDNDEMVNFVYGATILGIDELDKAVSEYVAEYETRRKAEAKAEVSYRFTKAGVKAFEDSASRDFFAEMEKNWEDQHLEKFDINVTCGKHKIRVPLGADDWSGLILWLNESIEEWEA
jgi:hypothetical protein